jgi:hypothetical protein
MSKPISETDRWNREQKREICQKLYAHGHVNSKSISLTLTPYYFSYRRENKIASGGDGGGAFAVAGRSMHKSGASQAAGAY